METIKMKIKLRKNNRIDIFYNGFCYCNSLLLPNKTEVQTAHKIYPDTPERKYTFEVLNRVSKNSLIYNEWTWAQVADHIKRVKNQKNSQVFLKDNVIYSQTSRGSHTYRLKIPMYAQSLFDGIKTKNKLLYPSKYDDEIYS